MSGGILSSIRKWSHTRGYGVHSPLAYTIVRECLYPDSRYGFYADSLIDFEYNEDRKKRRDLRRLIRLINIVRPGMLWIPGCDRRMMQALRVSYPAIKIATQKSCPKGADFVVELRGNDTHDAWQSANTVVCFDTDSRVVRPDIEDATLKITGKDYSIFLRRDGMDQSIYELP